MQKFWENDWKYGSSVLEQDYPNIEYIIVDGKSSDKTLEKIRSFDASRYSLISEEDQGLYDAINKGISLASGDIIGILHSDDCFAEKSTLQWIVNQFNNSADIQALAASVEIYKPEKTNKPFRIYHATGFKKWQFRLGMQPPHPGFFIRNEAFHKVGFYRIQYKISGDFEWLLRAILINDLKVQYNSKIVVSMMDCGLRSSGIQSKIKLNQEILKILKLHGIYSNKLLIYLKYFIKIFQLRFAR